MAEARSIEDIQSPSIVDGSKDVLENETDAPKDGGGKEYVEEIAVHWVDSHPECSVCLQHCLQPVILPCGHIFCFLCVKGFAYRSKKCALCRGEVTLDYFQTPIIVKVKGKQSEFECENDVIDQFDWFYEGHNGWWQYDLRASSLLEKAYSTKERTSELIIAGFTYVIDFCNMVQFRKSNPARCRRIKRDKKCAEKKGVAGLKTIDNKNRDLPCSDGQIEDSQPTGSTEKPRDSLPEEGSESEDCPVNDIQLRLSRLSSNDINS